MAVIYKIDSTDIKDVSLHLRLCDVAFVPKLSSRVNIDEYAKKIIERSKRFEAWSEGELIGLVAIYCNSTETLSAFITNVSVIPGWHGNGIANNLMIHCMLEMKSLGFESIELEVGVENEIAIKFYLKHDFTVMSKNSLIQKMNFTLKNLFIN
jgi:ribosomal protein S18 acetylase RimI-like enzyme